MFTHIVPTEDQGIRLDLFLSREHPDLSRSFLKKLVDRDQVTVAGKAVKAGTKLKSGDRVELTVPPPDPMTAESEDIPIDVLYEDETLIVVNKAPGMVVHPAAGNFSGTLVNAVLHHCGSLSQEGGALRPGIVHRLDKDTSGVLVVAKNDHAHRYLAGQFEEHSISRTYHAVVSGMIRDEQGTVSSLIGRHPTDRKRMSSRPRRGKKAVTHWKVVRWYNDFTLVEVNLETGRTHQIRVHLASLHHPVLGDPDYGGRKPVGDIPPVRFRRFLSLIKRQALHARTLGFVHPVTHAYMEFHAPPPADFQGVVDALENELTGTAKKG
jgi:23S rRNA pseudouridine1911/1915/1917 synthase